MLCGSRIRQAWADEVLFHVVSTGVPQWHSGHACLCWVGWQGAQQEAPLRGSQIPYMAAQDQEQDVEAPGSEGLGPGQYHIDPVLVVKAVPGLPGSKEEQRPMSRRVKECVAAFRGLASPCRLGSAHCAGGSKGAEAHSHPSRSPQVPVRPLENRTN